MKEKHPCPWDGCEESFHRYDLMRSHLWFVHEKKEKEENYPPSPEAADRLIEVWVDETLKREALLIEITALAYQGRADRILTTLIRAGYLDKVQGKE